MTDLVLPGNPNFQPNMLAAEFRKRLETLKRLASETSSDAEARLVISRIAQLIRIYRTQNGLGGSVNPIALARELNPDYQSRPHLALLSDAIAHAVREVERGHDQNLIVSMPPRAGKSTMTSLYGPLWILQRHPEWKTVMTSYDGGLTRGWAMEMRRFIEDKPDLGIALKRDGGAGGRWETLEGGGMYTVGVGGALTGRGARVMIIDDPIADFVAAHSPRLRQNLWNWWLSVAKTRLEPPSLVIVTMCMTGDTPVLRPDGTETPLSEIKPGDYVASMDHETGRLVSKRVLNWANQGFDNVYAMRMASGRIVRANARHPFRVVDENGYERWVRLESLQAGMKVRSVTAPIEESSVLPTTAVSRQDAKASACRTTERPGGHKVSEHPRTTPNRPALSVFDSATESLLMSIFSFLKPKKTLVLSADEALMRWESRSTGTNRSALTMTTTQAQSAGSFATTATSLLLEDTMLTRFDEQLSTWALTTDEILSIEADGREDVFDIEVEDTHNFIANGEESSNTRWHEDDFAGRLLSPEHEGNPKDWTEIKLPALADSAEDILGREEGQPLFSPLIESLDEDLAKIRWNSLKEAVGTYTFSAMYQQRPAPQAGAIFNMEWFRFWTLDPARATDDGRTIHLEPGGLIHAKWLDSWDMTFKGAEGGGDYVVGQRWAKQSANRYLIAQTRGRWSFTQTLREMENWSLQTNHGLSPYGHLVHQRLIEEKANGAAIIDVMHDHLAGIKAINPTIGKEGRARMVTPEIESGNIYLPHPSDLGNEWVNDLLSELRNFPYDAHDDQVDAFTQALNEFRDAGMGQITVPGKSSDPSNPLSAIRTIPSSHYRAAQAPITRRSIPGR